MNRRFTMLTCFLVVFLMSASFAQQVSLYGSLSLPVGGFGENLGTNPRLARRNGFQEGEDAGSATTGFALGADFTYPIGFLNLEWITGVAVMYNGSYDTELTSFFQQLLEDEEVEFAFSNWLQVPIMTGFKNSFPVGDWISLYAMVQAGISFFQTPTRKVTVAGVTVDERTYTTSRDFGYGLGAGIVLNKKFDFGARFFDFGKPLFDGERELNKSYFKGAFDILGEDAILGKEIPVSYLLVTLGYHF